MMNKVMLIGRIARINDMNITKSGIKYLTLTIAVDRIFKKDETDFIPLKAWDKQATFINDYLSKGSLVSVDGSFVSSNYEKDGEKRTHYSVNVNLIQSLQTKEQNEVNKQVKKEVVKEKEIPWEEDDAAWEFDNVNKFNEKDKKLKDTKIKIEKIVF